MKKQTKLLSVLFGLILIIATILSGCQYVNADVSLIENTFYTHTIYSQSNGKVTENIVINFDVFNRTTIEIDLVVSSIFQTCLIQKTLLENELNQKISENEDTEITGENFAVATERKNNKIAFTIYYYTQPAWSFFNSFSGEENTPEIIERLFDYTRIDRKDMVGTVTSLGENEEYFGNYLKDKVFDLTNNEDSTLISSLTSTSLYGYATPYSRRKSNAPYVATYEGLYYHMWDTTNPNVEFEFWYNLARVESWYILSLIIAFATVITILFVSHIKKQPKKVAVNVVNIESEMEKEIEIKDNIIKSDVVEQTVKKANDKKVRVKKDNQTTAKKNTPKKRIKTNDE